MTDVAVTAAVRAAGPAGWPGGAVSDEVRVSEDARTGIDAAVEEAMGEEVERFLAPRPVPERLEAAAGERLRSLIGHELRTPLTSVKGYARLLSRRDVPTEEVRVFGEMIADAVDRFDRVVEQLTAYTLLGSGRVEAHLASVDVADFVLRTVERWRTDEVDLTVDAEGGGLVALDTSVLAVGLDELLDNAVRFAIGRPRVTVTVRRGEGELLLSVRDEGPGMPADQVQACFEEFTQGQSPLTRDTGGLGLGLAIVRTVAHLHGGDVLCESRPGEGTTVSLCLPAGTLWPEWSTFPELVGDTGTEPEAG